jgi:hypothetical protein
VQVTFDRGRLRCSAADTTKKMSQGGALKEEKRGRREKEARGSPSMSESSGEACRWGGSGERFSRVEMELAREVKGRRGRSSRALYRWS